jgi:hypothetical protein
MTSSPQNRPSLAGEPLKNIDDISQTHHIFEE